MPKVGELIEYLMDGSFKADDEVTIKVVDPEKRLVFDVNNFIGIIDSKVPAIFLEISVGEHYDLDGDDELEEELECMDLEDQFDALMREGDLLDEKYTD